MIVAILGAGSVALANACWLAKEDHEVRIWSAIKEERQQLVAAQSLTSHGIFEGGVNIKAMRDAASAVAGAEIVMIAAPAFAHEALITAIAEHLTDKQLVVFHPVTGLSSLVLSRALQERNVRPVIADLSTSLFTARRKGFTDVNILKIKDTIDLATIPAKSAPAAVSTLSGLYGNRFRAESDVLAISLNNHNPIYHVGPFLCNLSRAEMAEATIFWDWITPGVAKLVEATDNERLAVVRHYGTTEVSVADYFRQAHGVAGDTLDEIFPAVSRKLGGPIGPHGFEHRFITEDVPFGLVFFWSLGQMAGIEMPTSQSLIQITSAMWQRDFISEGRTVDRLGLGGLDRAALNRVITEGFT
ncbi:MAG: NAD/NADP octopine/nopaline dehydrogenase family protein [Variibacter sp.]